MVECLRHVAGRAVDEVVRAELEESASLSVPRDRDGAEAEAHWRRHMENAAKVWLHGGAGEAVVDWTE